MLDPGFQLSFAAVLAIFVLAPRFLRALEGYPVPRPLAQCIAISTACGLATAPISWLHFHAIPLVTVPANAAAAPVVTPLLALALLAAILPPARAAARAAERLVRRVSRRLRAVLRRAAGRAGAVARGGRRARVGRAPRRRLCLAACPAS